MLSVHSRDSLSCVIRAALTNGNSCLSKAKGTLSYRRTESTGSRERISRCTISAASMSKQKVDVWPEMTMRKMLCVLVSLLLSSGVALGAKRIAVIVDTSGSMQQNDPPRYADQLAKILGDLVE